MQVEFLFPDRTDLGDMRKKLYLCIVDFELRAIPLKRLEGEEISFLSGGQIALSRGYGKSLFLSEGGKNKNNCPGSQEKNVWEVKL